MTSKGLFIFELSVALLVIGGIAFTAWQTQNIVWSLNQVIAVQEQTVKELKTSLGETEEKIRTVRGSVRPNVEKWIKALEKPLLAKTSEVVTEAQRSAIEAALKKWTETVRQENQKRWDNRLAAIAKEQKEIQQQQQQTERQWREVFEALRAEREAAKKTAQQEEKRWQSLMETLQKQGERADQQYREVVQQLTREKEEALARARQLEEERKREVNKLLEQANQIQQERKRHLSEFCAKRPESVICRDL